MFIYQASDVPALQGPKGEKGHASPLGDKCSYTDVNDFMPIGEPSVVQNAGTAGCLGAESSVGIGTTTAEGFHGVCHIFFFDNYPGLERTPCVFLKCSVLST